jgi:hypothetical protein
MAVNNPEMAKAKSADRKNVALHVSEESFLPSISLRRAKVQTRQTPHPFQSEENDRRFTGCYVPWIS